MEENITFRDLGLSEEILEAIEKKGFEEPSPIQALTIPVLLKGERNLIGQAQTGTGKTAAFGLPILDSLTPGGKDIKALILAPTRELAVQVADELNSLKGSKKLRIAAIYGGQSIGEQLRRLRRGVDIVVGTPGRVQDHINRNSMDLSHLSHMILDEADEMLNMGFVDDIEKILESVNEDKKMLLFSATMPPRILDIAQKYMGDYEVLKVKKQQLSTNLTDQIYFEVSQGDKFEALCRIIDIEKEFYGMVFCRTKVRVDEITNKLVERGYSAGAIHGDISQNMRERILDQFKSQKINILVATDVAARGIDVNNLTHVINYCLPQDPESYVHRIGRTGRAGNEGTAITFVTRDEYRKLVYIKRVAGNNIRKEKIPEVQQVISTKRDRIMSEILEALKDGEQAKDHFLTMAQDLLEYGDPVAVMACVLQHSFHEELNEENYNEIRRINLHRSGTTRLFVAKGRQDNMTPRALVDLIIEKTGIANSKIDGVQVFDQFSFITVPFEEAELIIHEFKRAGRGRRPMVEMAKESKGGRREGGHREGGHRGRGSRDFNRNRKGDFNRNRKGDFKKGR